MAVDMSAFNFREKMRALCIISPRPKAKKGTACRADSVDGKAANRFTKKGQRQRAAPCDNLTTPSALEHDPEKWVPVFGKDHAQTIN
jgi:hypothetical protein